MGKKESFVLSCNIYGVPLTRMAASSISLCNPIETRRLPLGRFKKLLRDLRYAPRVVVKDRLASYSAPCAETLPNAVHRQDKGLNNRAESSHQSTRERERRMRGFTVSQPGMPNDSCRSLAWSPICSAWAVTCCRRRTIGRL